jgi:signal transduction histidine kinase
MSQKLDYKQYPILYVDDERANLLVFRHNFGDQFSILTAESAEEALKVIGRESVAVLLTDQRMPTMTGVELAERVMNEHPEVVRMILTAYTDVHAAIEAINRGQVTRYITKPWRGDELGSLLRGGIEYFTMSATIHDLQLRMMRSERLALLGFVAAGIAHDLKSPLACLTSNIESLERDLSVVDHLLAAQPEQKALVDEMHDIVHDCFEGTSQINSFIDTMRNMVAGRALRREPVDLGQVCQSASRLCKGEILRRARLKVEPREGGPFVMGDAAQLCQVVLNLLVNAAQAIEPGKTSENEIRVAIEVEGARARVRVSDTGKGIPKDALAHIFDAFYSTKTASGGTGLGLAIVREIVRHHEGEVSVDSEVGRGTTFTVTMPIVPPA